MKLKVILEPSDEGGYTVYVPSLPGCISEGESREEALANIREAIELYLEPVDDDLAGKEGLELHELHTPLASAHFPSRSSIGRGEVTKRRHPAAERGLWTLPGG